MKKYAFVILVLLSGCATNDEPPFEIKNKQFHENIDEQGNKVFAYVVSVKTKMREKLPTGNDRGNGPSRSDVKRYTEQEYFEESSVLKLELEDQAVALLNTELKERRYCENDHEINEVLWRDLSVQLRGRCL
jgi:tricorn protease-like protein